MASVCSILTTLLVTLTITTAAEARLDRTTQKAYYGQELYERLSSKNDYPELKDDLKHILEASHQKIEGDFDRIGNCRGNGECYRHQDLGYSGARRYLFGKIHLKQDGDVYWLKGVYCGETFSSDNFPRGQGPGPMKIPNHQVVNAEHTWPQSKFSRRESKSMQKSDLHHLYPSNSHVNSSRGNFEFGEVDRVEHSDCPGSYRGTARNGGSQTFFEPPDEHKGNVARSLFYFSTRYDMQISEIQERFLREWHKLDPVDQEEEARNEIIFEIQKTRNPFIDHPELVNMIRNF